MRKICLPLIVFMFLISTPVFAQYTGGVDYNTIYEGLPVLDAFYENSEDPDEFLDYHEFMYSPYPLLRISSTMECKTVKLVPGYYLLTPKSYNGFDFVMFKQKGKIVAMIPVYEKQLINPQEVYKTPPKPKLTKKQIIGKIIVSPITLTKKLFIKLLGKHKKPPEPPKFALDTRTSGGGKYFEIWLYYENYVYKMLFKVRN